MTMDPDRLNAEVEARSALESCGISQRHLRPVDNTLPEWAQVEKRLHSLIGTGFLAVLAGGRGTGKTQLAASVMARRLTPRRTANEYQPWKLGGRVKYTTAMRFFMRVRQSYGKHSELTETEVISEYSKHACDLLVIDELQERGESAWEDRLLTMLIDERYGDMADTLLISNATPESLAEQLGPSVTSRIAECGGVIVCNWKGFRG